MQTANHTTPNATKPEGAPLILHSTRAVACCDATTVRRFAGLAKLGLALRFGDPAAPALDVGEDVVPKRRELRLGPDFQAAFG
jgi:hypothetical protein